MQDPVFGGFLIEAAASPDPVTRCRALLLSDRPACISAAQHLPNAAVRSFYTNAALAYTGDAQFDAQDLPSDLQIELPYYCAVNAYNGGSGTMPPFGSDVRSRALQATIRGHEAGRRLDYAEEARLLFEAAELYEAATVLDVPHYLAALEAATSCAFELGLPNEPRFNPLALGSLPVEQHSRVASIFRNVARSRWLSGRTNEAMCLLRDARSLSIEGAALASVRLDIARMALDLNEPNFAYDQIEAVRRCEIDWATAPPSFLTSIITYAYCVAKSDPQEAQTLLIQARNLLPHGNTVLARDQRLDSLWAFGEGMVEAALNHPAAARPLLTLAYDHFSKIRHHFRAARAALELARIEDRDTWLQRARVHALTYGMNCPLLEQADIIGGQAYERLTDTERGVARGLLKGESREHIATRMARSPLTIRNTIWRLYDKTGCDRNVGALIVRLQKCGEL